MSMFDTFADIAGHGSDHVCFILPDSYKVRTLIHKLFINPINYIYIANEPQLTKL